MSEIDYTNEQWKPVVGLESLYEVSDMGRVKTLVETKNKPAGGFVSTVECVRDGSWTNYVLVNLYDHGDPRKLKICYVHRVVAAAFISDPTGLQVNHLNGDGTDNRVSNLEVCTASSNTLHSARVLGRNSGENHYRTKLTKSLVRKIKKRLAAGEFGASIARGLGVSVRAVYGIRYKKSWKSVAI